MASSSSSNESLGKIVVNNTQRGNPVLKLVENVKWEFLPGNVSSSEFPDYILGAGTGALYLSLKYHLLHPDYLYARMREMKREFSLRLVLCVVDVQSEEQQLILLQSLATANGFTVVLAWSLMECVRYLETYKALENKPASSIQARLETEFLPRLQNCLTAIRSVNKTDVAMLYENFETLEQIATAPMEELALCPGIGGIKVQRIFNAFNEEWE